MTEKQVVQLSPNGFFVGLATADASPLEPGVYLLPAHCIDVSPPEYREGFNAFWNGSSWDYHQDYRGTEYWDADGRHRIIELLGEVPSSDAVFINPNLQSTSPAPQPDLIDQLMEQIARLTERVNALSQADA